MSLLFPKPEKRIKVRKPLKRSKKRPAARAKFKEFGANCTKAYRRRYTDYEVICQAEVCRQRRLDNATPAEEAFAAILTRLGVKFEREKVILNGDKWILIDLYVPLVNLAIEVDGNYHTERGQKQYDHQRSMWLARKHGMKVVRFFNADVLNGKAEQRLKEMLGLTNAR